MFKKSRKSCRILIAAFVMIVGGAQLGSAQEAFVGEIKMVGFNFAPRSYAFCDGQILAIAQNQALFALLGTTFGGDGRTTFALPDLRGRAAIHPGTGPGLSQISWGQKGGSEVQTLTVNNLPSHNHVATLKGTSASGNEEGPTGHSLATDPREKQYRNTAPNVSMNPGSITVENTGSNQAFAIRDPYLGIYHVIALQGIFPSRN